MSGRTASDRRNFRVIDGGRSAGEGLSASLHPPAAPQLSAAELAADMAELYALALVRDVPFTALQDPHTGVWIDGRTRFTLHELLCELRSLSWFDASGRVAQDTDAEAGARRDLRLNGDGQLTLRSLFRGVVARPLAGIRVSAFHEDDSSADPVADPGARPAAEAPMSAWVEWLERSTGARLTLPGHATCGVGPDLTPRLLTDRLRQAPVARVHFNAALMLLVRGTAFDEGLDPQGGADPISAQRLLALMAEAAERAAALALRRQARLDRLSRPGVVAARLTALLAQDEPRGGDPLLREVAEELQTGAPGLLHWITRLNARHGRTGRFHDMLLLPPLCGEGGMPHRAEGAVQGVVTGALCTLLKALFDTRRQARLRMVGEAAGGLDITAEADRLAADVLLQRSLAGSHFQAENHQDLRIGEAVALQVLRDWLEGLDHGASLSFCNFDGQRISLVSHRRATGQTEVGFCRDGRPAAWPMLHRPGQGHLAVI